jgi:acetyl-CoA carboxylase alpha subunit
MADSLKKAIADSLRAFQDLDTESLIAQRHVRIRALGKFKEIKAS